MNNTSAVVDPRLLAKPKRLTSLVMMLIVVVGAMGSLFAGYAAYTHNQDLLLAQARTAASALSPDAVQSLKGNADDLHQNNYKQIKGRLAQIRLDNEGVGYIYLTKLDNGHIKYLADSEP